MIIALASPRIAESLEAGLERTRALVAEAAAQGAEIVCFPEAYLPGLRGQDFDVLPFDIDAQARVLRSVAQSAREHSIAVIFGIGVDHGDGTADRSACL